MIMVIKGQDDKFWWTGVHRPTAADYHGTVNDSRGFDTEDEAWTAARETLQANFRSMIERNYHSE